MTHAVNRLQFEVVCPDEEVSLNLRQNFAQTVQQDIAGIIDEVCSESVGENESIKIDKIELDLGAFSRHNFAIHFKTVFRQKLRDELNKQLAAIPPQSREISRLLSDAEILLYFLSNGTLPWFADETAINPDEILANISVNHTEVLKGFLNHSKFNENVWKRLAWQFSASSKETVINLLNELKEAREVLLNWANQVVNKLTAVGSPAVDFGDTDIQKEFGNIDDIIILNAPGIFAAAGQVKAFQQVFQRHIDDVFKTSPALAEKTAAELFIITGVSKSEAESAVDIKQPAQNDTQTQSAPGEQAAEEVQKYSVRYAGIVLLAPFLKPFFTALHLLDGNEWKGTESAFRAVHLLKFLATGQTRAAEYSLVLEKILCGLPPEMPVPLDIILTEEEIAESEMLLKAVINHWKALKNTSTNGLRENFIKRDGLLTREQNGWHLRIERKTIDVLIDSIPWGFSTISLPWTQDLIFVEW